MKSLWNNRRIIPKEQRREQRKLERQISECENEIETLETTILQIDEQLTQPEVYNNPQKANELAIQKQDSEQKLEHAMSKWEELQQNYKIYITLTVKSL